MDRRSWCVDGLAYNGCAGPVHISMTIAYYDAKGVQFATGHELGEVAPGASWRFRHTPIMEAHQSALRSAKIIRVLVGR